MSPYEAGDGFLSGISAPAARIFHACLTDLDIDHVGEVVDVGCSVVDSTRVPSSPTRPTWMLTYRRRATLAFDAFVDTLTIGELVLVEADLTAASAEPVWHVARDQAHELLAGIETADLATGVLVSYLACLNGTGGCAQHFLLGQQVWHVVGQPYLEALQALLPDGWSLHKGRVIDLATLTGEQPIAAPGDPNCCPSGAIDFSVELRGTALQLVGATVRGVN